MDEAWKAVAGGLAVFVRLTPKAGADAIDGVEVLADGRTVLKTRVRAVPADNAANRALEALLARVCGLGKSAVHVESGGKSRLKTVRIEGDPAAIAAALRAAVGG